MDNKFKKLLAKKRERSGNMDDMSANAHGAVLGDLAGVLDGIGHKNIKGMKKVTVASDSDAGMKSGLDKAKEIVAQGTSEIKGGDQSEDDLLRHELEESPEYDDEESEEALSDQPENHIHTAEKNDPLSMHTHPASDMPEESMEDKVSRLEQEIERLKAPKPFY